MSTETTSERAADWAPPIDDPLDWQDRIDKTGLEPNMRGSARFWGTVQERGITGVWSRSGMPDFSEIVFALGGAGNIGLRLWLEDGGQFIRYGFCELAQED